MFAFASVLASSCGTGTVQLMTDYFFILAWIKCFEIVYFNDCLLEFQIIEFSRAFSF